MGNLKRKFFSHHLLNFRGRLNSCLTGLELVLLAAYLVLINWYYFDKFYVPQYDSNTVFQIFYYFYNYFFYHGALAQWMPFEPMGITSQYHQLVGLTPLSYLAMIGGRLFSVENTHVLFKLSVLGEQMMYVFSLYLLGRTLFKRRLTTVFLCLIAGSNLNFWETQLYFDLRIFYMLPLLVWALVKFFMTEKADYLGLLALLLVYSVMGTTVYPAAISIFCLFWMGTIWLLTEKNFSLRRIQYSRKTFLYLFLAVLLGALYLLQLKSLLNVFELESRSNHWFQLLPIYLRYGGETPALGALFQLLFAGGWEVAYFSGWSAYLCLFLALLSVRKPAFLAALGAGLILIWLSMQGLFSVIAYFFPPMAIFRHLYYIYGFIRLFVLLAAAFGLDNLLSNGLKSKLRDLTMALICGVFLLDGFKFSWEQIFRDYANRADVPLGKILLDMPPEQVYWRVGLTAGMIAVLVASRIYARLLTRHQNKSPGRDFGSVVAYTLLLGIFVLDLVTVTKIGHGRLFPFPAKYESWLYTVKVHPPQFVPERTPSAVGERQKTAFLFARFPGTISYSTICDFAQMDLCECRFRTEVVPKNFRILRNMKSKYDYARIIGCLNPKIRFVHRNIFVDGTETAPMLLKEIPRISDVAVLSRRDSDPKNAIDLNWDPNQDGGDIVTKSFSEQELILETEPRSPKGAWLVYADSYHPGWHATVDGKPVAVYRAYLNFKAIWVGGGKHTVRFFFYNGLSQVVSYLIAIFGIIGGLAFFYCLFREIFRPFFRSSSAGV